MEINNFDEVWMLRALELAANGRGFTSPNPPVGAVIVSAEGDLLGEGWHRAAGGPHAEIEALRSVPQEKSGHVAGGTIYITLEPCSTTGRTPACTAALIASGLKRVVYAMDDPNPRHAGRAVEVLEKAGISVTRNVLHAQAKDLLRGWTKFILTGIPYLVAKAGMSLDGRITRPQGEGQWLTSEASRRDAMHLRAWADAILVGAQTVRADNPSLTIRDLPEYAAKLQPWRVVLTNSGDLPPAAALFTDAYKERTLVMKGQDLLSVLRELGRRGVVNLLVEGGGHVLAECFARDLVDEFHAYIAPLICGSGQPVVSPENFSGPSRQLELVEIKRFSGDVRLIYRRSEQ